MVGIIKTVLRIVLLIVLIFGGYKGCQYMKESEPAKKEVKVTPSQVPKEYTSTTSINRIDNKYVELLLDSIELSMKKHYAGKLPKAAIDAIKLKDNKVIIKAVEQLFDDQLGYLMRTVSINFAVLDSIDKVKYDMDKRYRKQVLNDLIKY